MRILTCAQLASLGLAVMAVGCGGDDAVGSDEAARRAYLCLDHSIQKSMDLGFQGFTTGTNANIAPQMGVGDKAGTITISGQVDAGQSNNKQMRLDVGMVGYDDGNVKYNDAGDTVHVVFDTSTTMADQPYLELSMAGFPTGTFTGKLTSNASMTGVYNLSGDLKGKLTLDLMISGHLMAGTAPQITTRVPGMTTITGTATNSDGGVYNISITL